MDNTRTAQPVRLRSPFNSAVITITFEPGTVPTLETMLAAGFVRVDDDNTPKARTAHA